MQRISTVDNPNQGGPGLFIVALGLILLAGLAAVVFFAVNRESNIGVAPEANVDHWHSAYLIHECGNDLPASGEFDNPAGLHTHGDGLLHLHPFNPSASGNNATIGEYFAGAGATITDDAFVSGISDVFPITLSEADGCNGEDAILQLAVWENAFDEVSSPEIITENIADFPFTSPGMAITLALLPEGSEIPRPPADRIAALAETGAGGPIAGVEPGESPFVTTSTAPPPETEQDAEGDESTDQSSEDTTETTGG
ncbi:MAG: hypothetical protein ACR2QK_05600 [Acidimicrobiales bacterium]